MATQRITPNEHVHAALQSGVNEPPSEAFQLETAASSHGPLGGITKEYCYALTDRGDVHGDAAWRKMVRAERIAQRQEDEYESWRRAV